MAKEGRIVPEDGKGEGRTMDNTNGQNVDLTRPSVRLTGQDGNIFNLLGIASRVLMEAGRAEQAAEMRDRVFGADSYLRALAILEEYVHIR